MAEQTWPAPIDEQLQAEGDLLEERIRTVKPARPDILAGAFPQQLAFIRDKAPFKASFCTRRAAKSFAVGLEYIDDSYDYPRAHYLFLMTVRAQAKRDFWEDVLKTIDQKHNLGIRFNETELIATMPNGAKIYVGGADSSVGEWRKLLAGKWRKVHIDEAQAFIHMPLGTLVYETFKPAVADLRGTIGLSGTPGVLSRGLFFDVTRGAESGWSVHRWKTSDNPYMAEKIAAEIAQLKALKPGVELTPWFRRNYLAEWVIEDDSRVYRYQRGRNDFRALPVYRGGEWRHVLSCDLGHTDAASFQVGAYHDFDPCLYLVSAYKKPGMDFTDVANHAKALDRKFDFASWIIDGANKQGVEEMRRRHSIPWRAAEKTAKFDFIDLMNADFICGTVKLKEGLDCDPLREEYDTLVLDPKKLAAGVREEHATCPNHCADGGLYLWRYTFPYLSEVPPPKPAPGSPEALQADEDETERAAEAMARRQSGADDEDLQDWSQ